MFEISTLKSKDLIVDRTSLYSLLYFFFISYAVLLNHIIQQEDRQVTQEKVH